MASGFYGILAQKGIMSNDEAINLLKAMQLDDSFFTGISEAEKYNIVERLLERTEKISDPWLFYWLVSFAVPVNDELVDKILYKMDKNLKVDKMHLGFKSSHTFEFDDGKYVNKPSISLKTAIKILEKLDLPETLTSDDLWKINELLSNLSKNRGFNKTDIDMVLEIIFDGRDIEKFEGDDFGFLEPFATVYYLFNDLDLNNQNKYLAYRNELYKKMGSKFFKQSMGDNKEFLKKNIELLLCCGVAHRGNSINEKKYELNACKHKNKEIRQNCSLLGNTDYRIDWTPHADNALLHVFFYFMENIEIDGLDKEAKNKIFVDEIIKWSEKKHWAGYKDSYMLASCFELLAVNNYWIDKTTLEKLVNNILIKGFSSHEEGAHVALSAFSKSILDRLIKLYDGNDFGKIVNDCLTKNKTRNEAGGNKKIISQMQFDENDNVFFYRSVNNRSEWNHVYHSRLEVYLKDINEQYKKLAKAKFIEKEIETPVENNLEMDISGTETGNNDNEIKKPVENNKENTDTQETNADAETNISETDSNDSVDKSESTDENKIDFNSDENKSDDKILNSNAKADPSKIESKSEPVTDSDLNKNFNKERFEAEIIKEIYDIVRKLKNISDSNGIEDNINCICQKINAAPDEFLDKEQKQFLCDEFKEAGEQMDATDAILMIKIIFRGILEILRGNIENGRSMISDPKKFILKQRLLQAEQSLNKNKIKPDMKKNRKSIDVR